MGAGRSGLFHGTKGGKITIDGLPLTINKDKQGRHIKTNKHYQQGKSEITVSQAECQRLVEKYSGTGTKIGNKERVNFGKIIGYYVDIETGTLLPTTVGTIHYSKTGAHIVPARPIK